MEADRVLKNFMEEFFDFDSLKKAGLFKGIKRDDYKAQAEKVCKFFGFKTVYEYRAETITAHISYGKGERPLHVNEKGELKEEPFITVLPSIYE